MTGNLQTRKVDQMTRIAVLSTAHIHTKGFLESIVKGTDGRFVHVIWDDVEDRGRRYADSFKTRFEPDIKKVLRDRAVDGFLICAENTRHLPLLKKVLRIGKPVFCEKPLVTTVSDLKKVVRLLQSHPTKLMSGYVQPFSGTMQAVAGMLKEKALGQVTRARFRNAHHAAYGHWFDNPDLQWFHNPDLAGGGALMDMGTHAVHLLRALFGPVTEVLAIVGNHAGIYPAVDDFGVAHLKFASGVLGTVEAAWTQTGGIGGLEIVGSEKAVWNTGKEYVVGAPGKEPVKVEALPERPTRVDRLVGIIQGRVSDDEVKSDLAAILDSVAIMEASYKSAKTGRWAKVAAATV